MKHDHLSKRPLTITLLALALALLVVILPGAGYADDLDYFIDSGQALGNSASTRVALGDVDGDGDLDAFVANAGQADVGHGSSSSFGEIQESSSQTFLIEWSTNPSSKPSRSESLSMMISRVFFFFLSGRSSGSWVQ